MRYRIVMSNYTISVHADVFQTLMSKLSEPEGRWQPLEVDEGKWVIPTHIIAVETVAIADAPPPVLAFASDT